jgi:hypothetical protein
LAGAAPVGSITELAGGPGSGSQTTIPQNDGAIAASTDGKLIVADALGNSVREIQRSGTSEVVVAGNAISGYSGDGGLASAAELNAPNGVTVDRNGNVVISDPDIATGEPSATVGGAKSNRVVDLRCALSERPIRVIDRRGGVRNGRSRMTKDMAAQPLGQFCEEFGSVRRTWGASAVA